MRDPNRLCNFYNEMMRIHMEHFPDWRFGQLMIIFISWITNEKKFDAFFPEEGKMLRLFKEFAGEE